MVMHEPTGRVTRLGIVIPTYNSRALTLRCLRTLREALCDFAEPVEVVLVDNASFDGTAEVVRTHFPEVYIIQLPSNRGFAAAANSGIAHCKAPYVLVLNSDCFITDGAVLRTLVQDLEYERSAAAVGPRLLGRDGNVQKSWYNWPSVLREVLHVTGLSRLLRLRCLARVPQGVRRVAYVSGACLLLRRDVWEALGGFDEQFFMYHEEMEFCYRARKCGWFVLYDSRVSCVHLGGGSGCLMRPLLLTHQKLGLLYFNMKHGKKLSALALRILYCVVFGLAFLLTVDPRWKKAFRQLFWAAVRGDTPHEI